MSGLPLGEGGHGAQHHLVPDLVGIPTDVVVVVGCNSNVASEFLAPTASAGAIHKRKRRPAGTPDPGAEVVALSPKTLMESDRYVCEICNQGFQRDQNLQMHRRRHKLQVPWKLLKKPSSLVTNKRVYICPERSCLHHDPTHALGDLVGIKKHYRRKHCTEKQWKCVKCSKRYAVQSDYKAHLKTCGTRGHCCDCGRVFSRVESFIEHQDTCSAVKHKSMQSGGNASEGKLPVHQHVTDRNSHDSPSQSSDTTQAMSFAQSGMSDTTDDDRSRKLEAQQTTAAYTATEMPAWLMNLRSNELELLQLASTQQQPPAENLDFLATDGSSRSQVTRCSSSMNSARPEVSLTRSTLPEDVNNAPSLQLSIGPYVRTGSGSVDQGSTSFDNMHIPCLRLSIGPSSGDTMATSSCASLYADTKPAASFGSVCSHQRQAAVTVGVLNTRTVLDYKSSHPIGGPNDLALWIPEPAQNQTMGAGPPSAGTTPDQTASLRDFLAQAWRPGAAMQGCVSR